MFICLNKTLTEFQTKEPTEMSIELIGKAEKRSNRADSSWNGNDDSYGANSVRVYYERTECNVAKLYEISRLTRRSHILFVTSSKLTITIHGQSITSQIEYLIDSYITVKQNYVYNYYFSIVVFKRVN